MTLHVIARPNPNNPRICFVQIFKRRADDRGRPVQELVLEFRLPEHQVVHQPKGEVSLKPAATLAIRHLAAALTHNPDMPIQFENV
jgi:hypothetical protein